MAEKERNSAHFEISYDRGKTWRPMPSGWQQSGPIYAGPRKRSYNQLGAETKSGTALSSSRMGWIDVRALRFVELSAASQSSRINNMVAVQGA